MASYYYNQQQHQHQQQQHQHQQLSSGSSHSSSASHNHHSGRSRRAPRLSASQNSHRQFRGVRSMRDLTESPNMTAARAKYEAARSFDLDDDWEYCRALFTDEDYESINSSSTDGSLSSGSPQSSPLPNQIQPQPSQQVTPSFSLSSASSSNYNPATGFQSSNQAQQQIKIHQPSALRTRNAIPIVNPQTGMRLPSPPSSVSPAMMQQHQQQTYQRRW